ncbi:VasL domain-containing protein [Buttiauxella sp. S19-1]|uniref:VasL domain-containing protein n=1 Tax=Buttiauxella sp. S19-1 TaxID=941430 RepID=UPI001EDC21F1|nr:VasL domain-containing protein [Buttiauxella sp. S19-1]
MSVILAISGTQILKINSHDPRSHQSFLQFSSDMSQWRKHTINQHWWCDREKECLRLFQQHGYDLQTGVWFCLIEYQLNGWKGIASASLLFANGFVRQQPSCWPPLAAQELRLQILDAYSRQLLPLIYTLSMKAVSVSVLRQLLNAVELLEKQANKLKSTQHETFHQLSAWLETHISANEKQAVAPLLTPISLELPIELSRTIPASELSPSKLWFLRLLWMILGGAGTLSVIILMHKVDYPDVLRVSNNIWPGNPWVEKWQQSLEKTSVTLPINTSTQQLNQQLDTLEHRLLDAEQKRKPYITISELKTSIYEMRTNLNIQTSMVENQLNQLQIQLDNNQSISPIALYTLSLQIDALKNRLLLISGEIINKKIKTKDV